MAARESIGLCQLAVADGTLARNGDDGHMQALFLVIELPCADSELLQVSGEQDQLEASFVFLASRAPTDLRKKKKEKGTHQAQAVKCADA